MTPSGIRTSIRGASSDFETRPLLRQNASHRRRRAPGTGPMLFLSLPRYQACPLLNPGIFLCTPDFLSRSVETHRLRTSAAEHDQGVSRKRSLHAIRESRIASSSHGKMVSLLQVAQAFGLAIALSPGAGFGTGPVLARNLRH